MFNVNLMCYINYCFIYLLTFSQKMIADSSAVLF